MPAHWPDEGYERVVHVTTRLITALALLLALALSGCGGDRTGLTADAAKSNHPENPAIFRMSDFRIAV
jgi:hypothetical protein